MRRADCKTESSYSMSYLRYRDTTNVTILARIVEEAGDARPPIAAGVASQ